MADTPALPVADTPALIIHLVTSRPRMDLWCSCCQTYAAWEADLFTVTYASVGQAGSITGCTNCTSTPPQEHP